MSKLKVGLEHVENTALLEQVFCVAHQPYRPEPRLSPYQVLKLKAQGGALLLHPPIHLLRTDLYKKALRPDRMGIDDLSSTQSKYSMSIVQDKHMSKISTSMFNNGEAPRIDPASHSGHKAPVTDLEVPLAGLPFA